MLVFLSKLVPLFVYPLGLACIFLAAALLVKRRPGWVRFSTAAALAILWLGGNNWVSISLTKSLEWRYLPSEDLPEAEAIVVLGGGTASPDYPRQIVEIGGAGDRVIYAGWLYHQGAAPNLLLTGGNISWMGYRGETPAEEMASILMMLGVPQDAVWLETESRNTYENALYSQEMLALKGIDKIILVTSAQHMPRAVGLFEKQGLEVIPAPTDYSVTEGSWARLWEPDLITQVFNLLPKVTNLATTTSVMKEYFGILIYRLVGRI